MNGKKTAIVTGGAQGIGKAVVQTLLEDGLNLVVADSDREAGRETETELSRSGELLFVQTDVSQESAVQEMVAAAAERFGRIDYLVNNAGIGITKPIENLSLAEWNRVIGTNLTGTFLCTRFSAPHLRRTGGAVVNIASTRALMSEANTEAYSASKGGIVAVTHALAVSLGPEVRVNSISPGWIDTSLWKKKSERREPQLSYEDHAQHPAGRVGTPEDIARMVLFLLDERNSFITGQNFVVDGGMTKKMIYVE